MKLFIQNKSGNRSEIKAFPGFEKKSTACAWVGGYMQIHAKKLPCKLQVEEKESRIEFTEIGQDYKVILELCGGK